MASRKHAGRNPAPAADAAAGPGAHGPLDPSALAPEDLARLLTAAGGRHVTAETVRRHLDRGAPADADGRLHLLHYAAWLARELEQRRREEKTGGAR